MRPIAFMSMPEVRPSFMMSVILPTKFGPMTESTVAPAAQTMAKPRSGIYFFR